MIDQNILASYPALPDEDDIWAGEYPFSAEGSPQKIQHLLANGFNIFVDLTHPDDGLLPYKQELTNGEKYFHLPIPDNGVVHWADYVLFLMEVVIYFDQTPDAKMYIHCWGGVGRTGTLVAMLYDALIEDMTYEKSLELLNKQRLHYSKYKFSAPATQSQLDVLYAYYHEV